MRHPSLASIIVFLPPPYTHLTHTIYISVSSSSILFLINRLRVGTKNLPLTFRSTGKTPTLYKARRKSGRTLETHAQMKERGINRVTGWVKNSISKRIKSQKEKKQRQR